MGLGKKAAAHLKALRLYNGLTPEGLADILAMQRQAVSRWERGATVLSLKSFDDICTKLGLDPEKFICGPAEVKLKDEVLTRGQ